MGWRGIKSLFRWNVSDSSTDQGHASGQLYKMLLIGETGSGKTSFLNFICNAERIQAVGYVSASKDFRPFHEHKVGEC